MVAQNSLLAPTNHMYIDRKFTYVYVKGHIASYLSCWKEFMQVF